MANLQKSGEQSPASSSSPDGNGTPTRGSTSQSGFKTLVLLGVAALLGFVLLAVVVLFRIHARQREVARRKQVTQDMKRIGEALKMYTDDMGNFLPLNGVGRLHPRNEKAADDRAVTEPLSGDAVAPTTPSGDKSAARSDNQWMNPLFIDGSAAAEVPESAKSATPLQ